MIPGPLTRLTLTINKVRVNNKSIVLKRKTLNKISDQINRGGVTFCFARNKDYAKTENIAISPFPERSEKIKGKVTSKKLKSYCFRNRDLFNRNFSLGAWYDKRSLETYLDISVPIPLSQKAEAVTLGKESNQIAGFNLYDLTEIPLGGTGEPNSSLITPFGDRLDMALKLLTK